MVMLCESYEECRSANFGAGFDFDDPPGYDDDHVECQRCDFHFEGPLAEHLAFHHYKATRHSWTLTRRTSP